MTAEPGRRGAVVRRVATDPRDGPVGTERRAPPPSSWAASWCRCCWPRSRCGSACRWRSRRRSLAAAHARCGSGASRSATSWCDAHAGRIGTVTGQRDPARRRPRTARGRAARPGAAGAPRARRGRGRTRRHVRSRPRHQDRDAHRDAAVRRVVHLARRRARGRRLGQQLALLARLARLRRRPCAGSASPSTARPSPAPPCATRSTTGSTPPRRRTSRL